MKKNLGDYYRLMDLILQVYLGREKKQVAFKIYSLLKIN